MRQRQSKKRRLFWGGIALVAVAIAVVVGLSVGLTQANKKHTSSDDDHEQTQILMPLYTSPGAGAWDP
jgi:hypothetical protein